MSELKGILFSVANKKKELDKVFEPVLFRLSITEEKSGFVKLITQKDITVNDHILDHIKALIKIRNPEVKFNETEIEREALNFLGATPLEEYGVWVYYPWSRQMVHIPEREEFIEIRTSRNLYKISQEEREILKEKKIGVIGLSVGQSVSLTLALERICSEIRLADFDHLELSNLNRIRSGIHNLGILKVVNVAREIAEIDPFIVVKCFEEGATDSNLESFLTEGGKIDLLIEESDSIDMKVLSRSKAKAFGIPVVMESSDRCMVDVERFDLNPDLEILHGLLEGLDLNTLRNLKSSEEKIPYLLAIAGLEDASVRIKASMLEIEQSINTWPQLASAVTMGGGITADVCRRILLGQFNDSGRYHVDIEALIADKTPPKQEAISEVPPQPKDIVGLLEGHVIQSKSAESIPSREEIENIVLAATLAPSGGNSQPWKWVFKQGKLLLFNAFDSHSHFLGYGNFGSYIALGASIENAVIKAKDMHYEVKVNMFPTAQIQDLVAQLSFFREETIDPGISNLTKGIYQRQTNRVLGQRETIDPLLLEELIRGVAETNTAELKLFTEEDDLNRISQMLGELEKIRLLDKNGQRDFVSEIRWDEEENLARRDGIDLQTLELSNSELAGLRIAKNHEVIDLIRQWNGGNGFKRLVKKAIDASGAVGILSVKGFSPSDFVSGGRIMQRLWINTNLNGLAFQPMASSLAIYWRLIQGKGEDMSDDTCQKLWKLRPEFEEIFQIKPERSDILIFRLGKAGDPKVRSLRRPLEDIFINTEA